MRNPQIAFFSAAALMAGTLTLGLQAGAAWAAGNDGNTGADQPPGNNGTVKIDGYTMDAGQDNDPHVTCDFSVSFYGYDGGPQSATLTVTPVAPTPGIRSYTDSTSWNVGTRTSGSQFDRNVTVSWSDLASSLNGVTPQARQGYHLRLEVEVTGSRGSDDKYKVFWLQPCAPVISPASGDTTTTSSSTVAPTTTTTTTLAKVDTASGGATTTTTNAAPAATVPASVAGSRPATRSGAAEDEAAPLGRDVPAATTSRPVSSAGSGGSLAFTGADVGGLSAAGLGLIGTGAALTLRSRRKRQRGAGQ